MIVNCYCMPFNNRYFHIYNWLFWRQNHCVTTLSFLDQVVTAYNFDHYILQSNSNSIVVSDHLLAPHSLNMWVKPTSWEKEKTEIFHFISLHFHYSRLFITITINSSSNSWRQLSEFLLDRVVIIIFTEQHNMYSVYRDHSIKIVFRPGYLKFVQPNKWN